jgi:hypothetical protein
LEGLRSENVEVVYGHLEYFTDIWDILEPFGTFCVYLVHFVFIWYILCSFGTFFSVLVSCNKKDLATLRSTIRSSEMSSPSVEKNAKIVGVFYVASN